MRKLPFYMGLGMILAQSLIVGIFFLSQITVSAAALNMWGMIFLLVPLNLAAFTMLFYGLISKE